MGGGKEGKKGGGVSSNESMGRIEPLWDKNSYQGDQIQEEGTSYLNGSRIPSFVSEKPNSPIPTITVGPKGWERGEARSIQCHLGSRKSGQLQTVVRVSGPVPSLSIRSCHSLLCLRPRFGQC